MNCAVYSDWVDFERQIGVRVDFFDQILKSIFEVLLSWTSSKSQMENNVTDKVMLISPCISWGRVQSSWGWVTIFMGTGYNLQGGRLQSSWERVTIFMGTGYNLYGEELKSSWGRITIFMETGYNLHGDGLQSSWGRVTIFSKANQKFISLKCPVHYNCGLRRWCLYKRMLVRRYVKVRSRNQPISLNSSGILTFFIGYRRCLVIN